MRVTTAPPVCHDKPVTVPRRVRSFTILLSLGLRGYAEMGKKKIAKQTTSTLTVTIVRDVLDNEFFAHDLTEGRTVKVGNGLAAAAAEKTVRSVAKKYKMIFYYYIISNERMVEYNRYVQEYNFGLGGEVGRETPW